MTHQYSLHKHSDGSHLLPNSMETASCPFLVSLAGEKVERRKSTLPRLVRSFAGFIYWRNFRFPGSLTRHRIARQILEQTNFTACHKENMLKYVENCMKVGGWDLSCKMKAHNCYYFVRCVNLRPRRHSWDCTKKHLTQTYPICCDVICPL